MKTAVFLLQLPPAFSPCLFSSLRQVLWWWLSDRLRLHLRLHSRLHLHLHLHLYPHLYPRPASPLKTCTPQCGVRTRWLVWATACCPATLPSLMLRCPVVAGPLVP